VDPGCEAVVILLKALSGWTRAARHTWLTLTWRCSILTRFGRDTTPLGIPVADHAGHVDCAPCAVFAAADGCLASTLRL